MKDLEFLVKVVAQNEGGQTAVIPTTGYFRAARRLSKKGLLILNPTSKEPEYIPSAAGFKLVRSLAAAVEVW